MAECTGHKFKEEKKDSRQSSSLCPSPESKQGSFDYQDIFHFHIAAISGHVEILERFLQCGMAVDTKCPLTFNTALHEACHSDRVRAAELLISWGADIHMKTDDGYSALHMAVIGSLANADLVQLLLTCGASPNAVNEHDGTTPLMLAASDSNAINLSKLIAGDCDLDRQDLAGMTALHHCFSYRYYQEHVEFAVCTMDSVQVLVEAGANILIRDTKGRYPLTLAVEKMNFRAVEYFLANNAEPGKQHLLYQHSHRLTPLVFAMATHRYALMHLLWKAGAAWEDGYHYAVDLQPAEPILSQPRTLKEACRRSVREQLRLCGAAGCKFENSVEELLIPKPLQEFIMLKEELNQ